MTKLEKFLLFITSGIYLGIAIFSYSYVDLNLTLSNNQQALSFVKMMQQLGYYNRPAASLVYILLMTSAFIVFCYSLYLAKKGQITLTFLIRISLITSLILVFSYPFLSSDIFNYMFDAKIITFYNLSPYTHKALDFPSDDWIRFMRWTHRYSPYGPIWLLLTTIPSVLSFNKFILDLILFKFLLTIFNLFNIFLIYKISTGIKRINTILATTFYALNPLFLIEGIANGHNDVLVATFTLITILLIQKEKWLKSFLALILGALIKYINILMLPGILIYRVNKNIRHFLIINLLIISAFTIIISTFHFKIQVLSSSTQVQFQPWYLFWIAPYLAFFSESIFILPAIALAFGSEMRYLPFIYNGDWNAPYSILYMQSVIIVPLLITTLLVLLKSKIFK